MIRVLITDERGKQVGHEIDFASSILPHVHDNRFKCLRYIDPYGDTTFNQLQIVPLLDDLGILKGIVASKDDRLILEQLESLCATCMAETHLYLKFIGD